MRLQSYINTKADITDTDPIGPLLSASVASSSLMMTLALEGGFYVGRALRATGMYPLQRPIRSITCQAAREGSPPQVGKLAFSHGDIRREREKVFIRWPCLIGSPETLARFQGVFFTFYSFCRYLRL